MKLTQEQLTKAKAAKSVEELLTLAKESGVEFTEDEAKKYFAELHKEGAISDEELANVVGGCGRTVRYVDYFTFYCPFCKQRNQISFTVYDNDDKEQSMEYCPCGAGIELFSSTASAVYRKNGQEIRVGASSKKW